MRQDLLSFFMRHNGSPVKNNKNFNLPAFYDKIMEIKMTSIDINDIGTIITINQSKIKN